MNFKGLSLDQAPPISAPLRFILTAPIFLLLSAIIIFFNDSATLNRYSSEGIALVHVFTLGFFTMVMLGALQQMLPVLAGVTFRKAKLVAALTHAGLSIGTLFMVFGFLQNSTLLMSIASFFLSIAFVVFFTSALLAVKDIQFFNPTVRSIRFAIISSVVVVVMGLYLLGAYASSSIGMYQIQLSEIHAVLGIFAFAGVLIIGVAFQVLPMFYVAPAFKAFCVKYVIKYILSGAIIFILLNLTFSEYAWLGKAIIALFFFAFATVIPKKMHLRKRKVRDVTTWFWYIAAITLFFGLVTWMLDEVFESDLSQYTALYIGLGFLLSILNAMMYKIIAFIVWFHLNAKGYMTIPTMKEMIEEKLLIAQFLLHVSAIISFSFTLYLEVMLKVGALFLGLSALLLTYNLFKVAMVYINTIKREPDFVMPTMSV